MTSRGYDSAIGLSVQWQLFESRSISEVDLSITQKRLIASLVQRLNATVGVNITYAQLLRELLPVPRDPATPLTPELTWRAATPAAAPAAAAP